MASFSDLGMSAPLLHIGYPKCMSTWLQRNLFRAEQGFITFMGPIQAQLTMIDPVPFGFEPGAVWKYLEEQLRELAPPPNLVPVITSESLSGNMFTGGHDAEQLAARVRTTFPEGRILIVVREQRSLIRSLYDSWMAWGLPHKLERMLEPVDARTVPQFNLDYLRYHRLVTHYCTHYGPDRVLVLPYELFCENPRRFVSLISQFARPDAPPGLDPSRLPFKRSVNRGRSLVNAKFHRLRNLLLVSGPHNHLGLVRDTGNGPFLRMHKSNQRERYVPRSMRGWFEEGFRNTVASRTEGAFGESNRLLAQATELDLEAFGYEIR